MVSVARHKTAIGRSQLSAPMQMLARHGFLDGEHSIIDYGCGRGDDIAILQEAKLPVRSWDPHYAPDTDLSEPASCKASTIAWAGYRSFLENPPLCFGGITSPASTETAHRENQ